MGYVLPYREILLIWVLVDTNGTAIPTPRWGQILVALFTFVLLL